MTTALDIAALMQAIDDGDDSALPILADALDEAGDPRAAGLRRIPWIALPLCSVQGWTWEKIRPRRAQLPHHLPESWFFRLKGGGRTKAPWGLSAPKTYPTRSSAYLALAAALTEE
jgi:hypothetical protein